MVSSYKTKHTFDERVKQFNTIKKKFPDRIPIIVEPHNKIDSPEIDKNKFLVPCEFNMFNFIFVVRKRITLTNTQSLFFFINDILPPAETSISKLYDEFKDDDGFLYVTIAFENTFGFKQVKE